MNPLFTAFAGPLKPLTNYKQFILYKLVQSTKRPSKNDKLPCDHRTGRVANALDTTIWTDHTTAMAAAQHFGQGYGVGFVFSESSQFWFLDIDNCRTPDGWSPIAQYLCTALTGAAIEISSSGNGLHLFGTGTVPTHGTRYAPHGLEFYTSGRFVALTGVGAIGDAGLDCSSVLPSLVDTYFPANVGPSAAPTEWTTEPCEGWNGPRDDDELIGMARASMTPLKEAAVAFGDGGKASFDDLWTANLDALVRTYPPQPGSDKAYGESEADQALFNHLAYFTGKDCKRMRRLAFRSELKRDKWEREDYIERTILNACAGQIKVYCDKQYDLSPVPAFVRSERVSIADLFTNPPAPQRFLIEDILPGGVLTLLGAHGGSGKSMLALIASVCLVTGRTFMGKRVEQCRVLFYSAEDPAPIIRRRLSRICQVMGIDPTNLDAGIVVLDATEYPTLYTDSGRATQAYETLRADVIEFTPGVVIIDNASDTYDANEIERARVREFIRLLAGLGKPSNAAVLLLAHIDKQTARAGGSGEGYSGSTAWHNSARSRLFLSSQDEDGLMLEHQKSNLGARSQPIYLKWADGGLIELAETPGGTDHQATVLRLLKETYGRGEYIAPAPNASNNVYKVLQRDPAYPRILKRDDLTSIIRTLLANGTVTTEEYSTNHRNKRLRYAVGALSDLPQT